MQDTPTLKHDTPTSVQDTVSNRNPSRNPRSNTDDVAFKTPPLQRGRVILKASHTVVKFSASTGRTTCSKPEIRESALFRIDSQLPKQNNGSDGHIFQIDSKYIFFVYVKKKQMK